MKNRIIQAFSAWTGKTPDGIYLLPASGSHRKYYRIQHNGQTLLGVYNDSADENEAYFSFAAQFAQKGLKVPRTLHICPDRLTYFVEDLGDTTLYSVLPLPWPENFETTGCWQLYLKVIDALLDFQLSEPVYEKVYPVEKFDHTAMMWDLNYFKYNFLKISGIEFSEPLLEKDFEQLCNLLCRSPQQGFMYRDFQSRNIMVYKNEPWFIDFQGGRRGPLGYDLASLLYDAKADISFAMRQKLLAAYVEKASLKIKDFDTGKFHRQFHACVLLRILQAMGAYGLRGIHEKKAHFLKSIPLAVRNLNFLLDNFFLPCPMPELERIIKQLKSSPWADVSRPRAENLCIHIYSFSVRDQNPPQDARHGGGFVFDCRFLPNPGREEAYKQKTGRSPEVIQWMENYPQTAEFMQNCMQIIKPAVENYIERNFEYLSVSFGCTGGQHRSVYCAEKMKQLILQNFDIKVEVHHLVHPE